MKQIVGFSGGIDSQRALLEVRRRFRPEDIIALNSNAGGNEHPLTDAFIDQYSREVFPVIRIEARIKDLWLMPGFAESKGLDGDTPLSFEFLMKIKNRAPSRHAQFCTEVLKIRPTKRWIHENVEDEFEQWTGIRRDESFKRANTPARYFDDLFDCWVNCPLVDMKKQQCFDDIRAAGEPINPLYSLGFGRVGCAPCVNSGKEDIRLWADRFPEMIDKIRVWERNCGFTFFRVSIPGTRPRPNHVGKQSIYNWIDEVVDWSRTDYGGYQFNILNTLERPACESRYGLCE